MKANPNCHSRESGNPESPPLKKGVGGIFFMKTMTKNQTVKIGKITLQNPIMPASGCFGYGLEYEDFLDLSKLGAIVTKGTSLEPKQGNPSPRIWETPSGMLNSIGLENPGFKVLVNETLPKLKKYNVPVIVNFFGKTADDYIKFCEEADEIEGIDALEANLSCPNVKEGGISFGTCTKTVNKLVAKMRKKTTKTLIAKLTPNVTDITSIAKAAEDGGADALTCINTLKAMAIDIHTGKPQLANIFGGLSGPAIKPVAIRCVYEVSQTVKIPVIGCGGISSIDDVHEFLLAGAKAVQIGTANFKDPGILLKLINAI